MKVAVTGASGFVGRHSGVRPDAEVRSEAVCAVCCRVGGARRRMEAEAARQWQPVIAAMPQEFTVISAWADRFERSPRTAATFDYCHSRVIGSAQAKDKPKTKCPAGRAMSTDDEPAGDASPLGLGRSACRSGESSRGRRLTHRSPTTGKPQQSRPNWRPRVTWAPDRAALSRRQHPPHAGLASRFGKLLGLPGYRSGLPLLQLLQLRRLRDALRQGSLRGCRLVVHLPHSEPWSSMASGYTAA
jgi:hypothetical protein